jgi:hypothetical protein
LCAIALAGAVALVFWQQIAGLAVFIGESDRLNSYLNIRLIEYDALQAFGRVPAWSPRMFGGFSLAALHWMNPGRDPIAYVLQLLPRSSIFQALGFLPIGMLIAACFSAYCYIRDVTDADVSSAIGGLAYGLSVFSIHRAAQVDNAELTVVLIPLGLLALRRARPDKLVRPMLGLTLVMTALAIWGFLQEVAYAFLFFGAYAFFRAVSMARQGRAAAMAPVVVMAAAACIALIFAGPRLLTIYGEFALLVRTKILHYYDYSQILRFFHEGIYGRYFEEGRLLGHGMNLNEGLQLLSSTALILFVCLGIARPRSLTETVGALGFFSVFLAVLPASGLAYGLAVRFVPDPLPFALTLNAYKVLAYGICLIAIVAALVRAAPYLRVSPALSRLVPAAPRPVDTSFHLFALPVVLFAIVVYEGTYFVWRLFGRADFTHMRLSILALLPLCTLFAIYHAELKNLPLRHDAREPLSVRAIVALTIIAGGVSYLVNGPFLEALIPRNAVKLFLIGHNELMPTVAVEVLLDVLAVGGLAMLLVFAKPKRFDLQAAAGIMIGAFVVVEILSYAHLKVAGPQTWSYPVPFRMFNYFNVKPSLLRPPTQQQVTSFREAFDNDHYRVIVLSDEPEFPGTKIPHIAAFWGAQTIGGYGTGVPARLAYLPWPKNVQTLRTIDFTSMRNLDASMFPLLALMNVKYLIVLTPDIYFNVASHASESEPEAVAVGDKRYPLRTANVGGVSFRFFENPVNSLPRQFMVERVVGQVLPPEPLRPLPFPAKGKEIEAFHGQVDDLTKASLVENEYIGETKEFDASGELSVTYLGDVIDIKVTPSARERFVVLNQTYNPGWQVYDADATGSSVVPANLFMTGVVIPAGRDHLELRFSPFSSRPLAAGVMLTAMFAFGLCIFLFRRIEVSQTPRS